MKEVCTIRLMGISNGFLCIFNISVSAWFCPVMETPLKYKDFKLCLAWLDIDTAISRTGLFHSVKRKWELFLERLGRKRKV